eukprot:6205739-Pleurochrysis_carterae.AAC.3
MARPRLSAYNAPGVIIARECVLRRAFVATNDAPRPVGVVIATVLCIIALAMNSREIEHAPILHESSVKFLARQEQSRHRQALHGRSRQAKRQPAVTVAPEEAISECSEPSAARASGSRSRVA